MSSIRQLRDGWAESKSTEALKDWLASFSHTLTHPRGQATTEWDRETLTLASESAERRTYEQVLDAQGRVVRMESGGFEPVDITYDARNRPVTITQGTRTQSVTYDSNGFMETITGADGTLRLNRDAMGRVLKTTRQDLSEIDFAYDLLGNLTDLTPPGREAWTMSHDFRGQMLTLVTPLGSEETYLLDRDGRLVSATMADGREVSVTYDTSARVDRVVADGRAYDYVYGEDAYLATVSGGDADVAFEWDGPLLTRQASSGAVSGDITWTWEDGTLALSTMKINGHDVDFTFDKDGMPVQVGPLAITYIRGSSLLREREIADVRITHAYNDFGELDDLRIRADGELFRVRYTHDDLGRIAEARETILGTTTTWNYAYDLVGQLIEVRQDGAPYATYSYDENGNRTDIPGVVHNGDDQLLQYGDTSYTYNAAGQLVEKVRGAELTRYDYSVLGELEQVELPDGRAIDYQHDAMQRRIGRQVDGVQTHRWLWGGAEGPVAEVDANGNTEGAVLTSMAGATYPSGQPPQPLFTPRASTCPTIWSAVPRRSR